MRNLIQMSCLLHLCTILRGGNSCKKENKHENFTEVECLSCFTLLRAKLSCSTVTIKSHPDLTAFKGRIPGLNALSVQSEKMYLKQEFILKYDASPVTVLAISKLACYSSLLAMII